LVPMAPPRFPPMRGVAGSPPPPSGPHNLPRHGAPERRRPTAVVPPPSRLNPMIAPPDALGRGNPVSTAWSSMGDLPGPRGGAIRAGHGRRNRPRRLPLAGPPPKPVQQGRWGPLEHGVRPVVDHAERVFGSAGGWTRGVPGRRGPVSGRLGPRLADGGGDYPLRVHWGCGRFGGASVSARGRKRSGGGKNTPASRATPVRHHRGRPGQVPAPWWPRAPSPGPSRLSLTRERNVKTALGLPLPSPASAGGAFFLFRVSRFRTFRRVFQQIRWGGRSRVPPAGWGYSTFSVAPDPRHANLPSLRPPGISLYLRVSPVARLYLTG